MQAQTFGRLKYEEKEHGWAFDLGNILGGWVVYYGLTRSRKQRPLRKHRELAVHCQSRLSKQLQAHQIGIEIPDYDDFSVEACEATIGAVLDGIEITCSPAHCAFTLIGQAASFIRLGRHIPEIGGRSSVAIEELQPRCHTLFPDGVPCEAILECLGRTEGSLSGVRQVLQDSRKPMVILLVLADPLDSGRLRLLTEQQRLSDSLSQSLHRDRFEIQTLAEARLDNFGPMLARTKPTIIHFSGHGSRNGIYFNGPTGQATRIEPSQLSQLLRLASQDNLQGIFMNACFTAEMFQAQALDQDAVVMEGELSDTAAVSFAQQFYAYLGDGRSFKDAFTWAQASTDLTGAKSLRVSFMGCNKA